MQHRTFGHLITYGLHRIERRHRFLEDHGDLATADLAKPGFFGHQKVFARKLDTVPIWRARTREGDP